MKAVPAQYVFGAAVLVFGLGAGLVPVAGGYAGLMVLRFLLGCGEGVLTMGFLYLSQWYKPEELALRTGKLPSLHDMHGRSLFMNSVHVLVHPRCFF